MPNRPSKPKTDQIPPGATHFDLWKLELRTGAKEGRKYKTWVPTRLRGAADAQGRVTDRWMVSELHPVTIRRRWGAGRYRVRFSNEAGEVLGQSDMTLETPAGEASGSPLEAGGAGEDLGPAAAGGGSAVSRLRGMAGRQLDGGGMLELMLMMQDQADRAAARAREDATIAAARDREFFAQMMGLVQQSNQQQRAAPAAAAPAVDASREWALMRRENALTLREQLATIRQELLDNQPDPDAGPTNAGEALERAGVGLVEGLGEEAPAIVGEALGALRQWLKAKGQPATPANVAAVIEAVRAAAIGQANGGVEHEPDDE
jgi:hypothetical protein